MEVKITNNTIERIKSDHERQTTAFIAVVLPAFLATAAAVRLLFVVQVQFWRYLVYCLFYRDASRSRDVDN